MRVDPGTAGLNLFGAATRVRRDEVHESAMTKITPTNKLKVAIIGRAISEPT